MKKNLFLYLLFALLFFSPRAAFATVDPLTTDNNKFGIHIFDPSEIDKVNDLVNTNGGEWGYVTVPIRSDDRDLIKWNEFMHKAKDRKLIPILRLATFMTSDGWSKPYYYADVDFANFLNGLDWPVKNRYIIVYNEPNHAQEWGGDINPSEYAEVLSRTTQTFKDRNPDFFILPAGLDTAAPNDALHMNWRRYLQIMQSSHPEALASIDGWNSHSYPNPAFSSAPSAKTDHSIMSFIYETKVVESYVNKRLPVFITETGWSNEFLSSQTIARYMQTALDSVWNNSKIVAITPFVLRADAGPFEMFSFYDHDGNPSPVYEVYKNYLKVKGNPLFTDTLTVASESAILGIESTQSTQPSPNPNPEIERAKDTLVKMWNWLKGKPND